MGFGDMINYAKGVMIFEGLAASRATPPMTDKAGANRHEQQVKEQLLGLWELMFPYSVRQDEETIAKRKAFSERMKKQEETGKY